MNVFGIGLPELAVIAAIGLLVFGPKRLPELGKTLGRTLKGFQSASSEFEKEFRSAIAPVADSLASAEAASPEPPAPEPVVAVGSGGTAVPGAAAPLEVSADFPAAVPTSEVEAAPSSAQGSAS